jgi:hypothetical protein
MTGLPSNVSVSTLGRFLGCPEGLATLSEPVGVASGWPPVSRDSPAVGVTSVGAVRFTGCGGPSSRLLAGVIVIAVVDAPTALFVSRGGGT